MKSSLGESLLRSLIRPEYLRRDDVFDDVPHRADVIEPFRGFVIYQYPCRDKGCAIPKEFADNFLIEMQEEADSLRKQRWFLVEAYVARDVVASKIVTAKPSRVGGK